MSHKIQNIGVAKIKTLTHSLFIFTLFVVLNQTSHADSLNKKNINIINESITAIRKNSIYSIGNKAATDSAIQGIVNSLDPYSQLMTPEQYKNVSTFVLSDMASLGVNFKHYHNGWVISSIKENSAADKGGLLVGDTVLAINDTSISEQLINNLNSIIQAQAITTIDIIRNNKRRRFQIKNNDLAQAKVSATWLENDSILLIKIPFFVESTPEQIKTLIAPLKKENTKAKGIIIDLRDNLGGLLTSAIDTADLFLNTGKIVGIKGREVENRATSPTNVDHYARENALLPETPMLVLVNKQTASSAEMLSAALQENKRAHIVGQKTYGKGSIQAVVPLSDGYAIKLTTAFYYTPKGNKIDGRGLTPNLTIADLDSSALTEELLMNYLTKQF